MTAPVETLRLATLTWVQAYANPAGTALTAAQVIFASPAKARPPLPYITIDVISPGPRDGHDDTIVSLTAGVPYHKARGRRTATISLQGYGEATAEWLEELRLSSALGDDVADTLEAAGYPRFGFMPGAMQDVGKLLDSSSEARHSFDVTVHYEVTSAPRVQVELETIEADVTYSSDAYDDLTTDISVSV